MFNTNPAVLGEIVLRTFVVYLVVIFGLRVFGKRELGQMTPFDLVLVLTLSNAVQNAMTGSDNSLTGGIVSALTLLTANWALNRVGGDLPWVRHWIVGSPSLLVHDGKPLPEHMRREGIDEDELLMAARQHEVDTLADVQEAVLEVDGTISIIPKEEATKPFHSKRRKHSRKMP